MTILFADDHTIFREGVAGFIQAEECCEILYTAHDIAAARRIIAEEEVDMVITDLNFPEESGIDLLDFLKIKKPETPIIVLSMLDDMDTVRSCLQRGARGYITKSSGFSALSRAIEEVAAGGYCFDQHILSKLADYAVSRVPDELQPSMDGEKLELLSERQKEVFLLLAGGLAIEQIAEKLYISLKTVENHRSQIYKKLGVKDRLELHRLAEKLELL